MSLVRLSLLVVALGLNVSCLTSQAEFQEILEASMDADGDGHKAIEHGGDDCNDQSAESYPGADPICGDELDNDCDDDADEGADTVWYLDGDGDGYGVATTTLQGCNQPGSYADNADDCDDDDAALNPETVWHPDQDDDGYGNASSTPSTQLVQCVQPEGYALTATDCNDLSSDVFPGAEVICEDTVVNDCEMDVEAEAEACAAGDRYGLTDIAVTLYGADVDDRVGSTVAFLGDMDRDGVEEWAVGAPGWDHQDLWIVEGVPEDGSYVGDVATRAFSAEEDGEFTGPVVPLGDLDGDRRPDIAVGFQTEHHDLVAIIMSRGFSSFPSRLSSADAVLELVYVGSYGYSIASAGDLNNNGNGDLIVGLPEIYFGSTRGGSALAIYSTPSGRTGVDDISGAELGGEYDGDLAGFAVDGVGDFNGDGRDDVVIGAPGYSANREDAGAAYVVLGKPSSSTDLADADLRIDGENTGDQAGYSVSGIGDINNDGRTDIIVGAPFANGGGTDSGAAYLVLGPYTGVLDLGNADAVMLGYRDDARAGSTTASAGDVDDDGRGDFMIAAPGHSEGDVLACGAVFLFEEQPQGTISLRDASLRMLGADAYGLAGAAVDGARDLDADGHSDILVGAWGDSTHGEAAGAAHLIFGGDL
ncbi:MAG: FG-GAP repeat protein [Alphaproteobacteria bacterium]|nr:FG-GAP repeat protein [Alphaproteobacteria bacterium]